MKTAAVAVFLLFAISIAGHWDMQEAQRQEQHYIDMVCAGAWPDYNNREPECNE